MFRLSPRTSSSLAMCLVFVLTGARRDASAQLVFRRADSNADGHLNISDPVHTLFFLFLGTAHPPCRDASDSNDDGALGLLDPVQTLVFLFQGGPLLPAPFMDCGRDPTDDALDCISFPPCAPPQADVQEVWARRYSGPGLSTNEARVVAVDMAGNVYVTGWSKVSDKEYDYATVKYSPDGQELWVKRYSGTGLFTFNRAFALGLDSGGNAYVTGESGAPGVGRDYATVKYSPDGEELWVRRYDGPGSGNDSAIDLVVDSAGDVYVTGLSASDISRNYATVKYSTDGQELWVIRDGGTALGVDGAGNLYMTGSSRGSATGRDFATLKYSPDGEELWVRRYGGPGPDDDRGTGLAIDSAGNICVTGLSVGADTGVDYATIKYSPEGQELWVKRYTATDFHSDAAWAVAVDDSGNVYVTGTSWALGTDQDYATIKYSPDGQELWVRRYTGSGAAIDRAFALALDAAGNVYVTGYSWMAGTEFDYATLKYSPQGQELWVKHYNGPASRDDDARHMVVDGAGNVYVTGESWGSDGDVHYATVKYSPRH